MTLHRRLGLLFERLWLGDSDFDEIRNHFGDEVGFYYAWLSHYTTWLGALGALGMVVSLAQGALGSASDDGKKLQNVWGVVVMLWAAMYLCYWARRNNELTLRWQLTGLEHLETPRHEFRPHKVVDAATGAETFPQGSRHYPVWKRVAKTTVLLPIMLVVICILIFFVVFVFWFELWIIFDWGKCTQRNDAAKRQFCPTQDVALTCTAVPAALMCSDSTGEHGFVGWLMELCPGLMEALFFELMLFVFRAIVARLCRLQNWRTQQHFDQAFATQIFVMEFVGM